MNKRIKEIRKTLKLNGENFGKRLGVTKTAISNIENGNRNVTEQMIKLICNEFNINEKWLRTGSGEMFNKISNYETINLNIKNILKNHTEYGNILLQIITLIITKFDENDWEIIKNLIDNIKKEDINN